MNSQYNLRRSTFNVQNVQISKVFKSDLHAGVPPYHAFVKMYRYRANVGCNLSSLVTLVFLIFKFINMNIGAWRITIAEDISHQVRYISTENYETGTYPRDNTGLSKCNCKGNL